MIEYMPGPWVIEPGGRGGFCIRDRRNYVIAQRPPWPHHAHESEANAYLIAAAPDMRDALGEAGAGLAFAAAVIQERGGCNCSRLNGKGVLGFVCSPHKAMASVRAAIARAEGRA